MAIAIEGSIRKCLVKKWSDFNGYGFNLHAEKGKAGQYVGKVDDNSPAEAAGLLDGDRIIEVNDVNIGNENHQQVVTRIKSGGDRVTLLVADKKADEYCKNNKIVVSNDLPGVKVVNCPDTSDQVVKAEPEVAAAGEKSEEPPVDEDYEVPSDLPPPAEAPPSEEPAANEREDDNTEEDLPPPPPSLTVADNSEDTPATATETSSEQTETVQPETEGPTNADTPDTTTTQVEITPVTPQEPETKSETQAQEPEPVTEPETQAEPETVEIAAAPEPEPEPEPVKEPEPEPVKAPEPEPVKEPEPAKEPEPEPAKKPEPEAPKVEQQAAPTSQNGNGPAPAPSVDTIHKMSAAEMREALAKKKKADPRKEKTMSAKAKLDMFQRL